MNYLDIIIILLLVGFGLGGWKKGVITEAATLIGLGLGLYGAFRFSDYTAEQLVEWVEINPKYLNIISFIVTFVVVAIVVSLIGKMVAKVVESLNLGFIDRIGGFLVGLAKGLLLCSLMVMLLHVFKLTGVVKERAKEESVLYPWVEKTVPYVYQGFDLVKEAVRNAADEEDPEAPEASQDKEGTSGEEAPSKGMVI